MPIADMSVSLPYLMSRLRDLKVSVSHAEVASFDDLRTRHPADATRPLPLGGASGTAQNLVAGGGFEPPTFGL